MIDSADPLASAIADVEREQLGGAPSAPPADVPEESEPEAETTGKRGRKRDPNSRRSRAGAYGNGAAAASGKVSDPPAPDVRIEFPKMDPDALVQTIAQLDAAIVRMAGTAPLSRDEMQQGAGVFAPVLDHYMPLIAEKGGVWLPAFTWVVLAYGPRAYEKMDAIQRRKAGLPPATEAPAANPGAAGFSGAALLGDR